MGDGPSDDDVRRAQKAAEKAKETAKAMSGYHGANQLDPARLRKILDEHAPGNDAASDGVFDSQVWTSTDTFYRFTEDYVPLEKRLGYKMALERAFPGKK